ncbi:MAG: S-methyl-5-thioribose-1-phosphate isomerase [Phycisphaerae bacterium]|jgi:methylthioribose-1-phosphate isomerase
MSAAHPGDDHSRGGLPATLAWIGDDDGFLRLIDQTLLPGQMTMRDCRTVEDVYDAIRVLCVRGAPAIGVAAAFGLCLGTRDARENDADAFRTRVAEAGRYLCSSRPTAVNLSWAIRRVSEVAHKALGRGARAAWSAMLDESRRMAQEDADVCRRIGEIGAALIPDGGGVLTHCNAGALATVAYGTALAPMYVAHEQGRRFRIFADETRPLLQGARLTAFELNAAGIDVTVLCDNSAASLMQSGAVHLVIVGADRIAANGDTANKIGTYGVAVLARHHNIPFYVAAPRSTFDLTLATGAEIPIEQRGEEEVRGLAGREVVPPGVRCHNPAFDVTPAGLITGIVCEGGLAQPVTEANIRQLVAPASCNPVRRA